MEKQTKPRLASVLLHLAKIRGSCALYGIGRGLIYGGVFDVPTPPVDPGFQVGLLGGASVNLAGSLGFLPTSVCLWLLSVLYSGFLVYVITYCILSRPESRRWNPFRRPARPWRRSSVDFITSGEPKTLKTWGMTSDSAIARTLSCRGLVFFSVIQTIYGTVQY